MFVGYLKELCQQTTIFFTDCARDTVVHFPEKGMTVSEVCNANGNYRPNQVSGDRYYCVDSDGYPTTDFMDDWPADNCAEFM